MKCTTREAAAERYGHIDLASKYWPQERMWIKTLHIPDGWFPFWKILDTDRIVTNISCNLDMHEPLMAALKMVHEKGLGSVLKTYDGAFNIRAVRGSNNVSAHAYGLAIDINASMNPLGSTHGDFAKHMDVVNCFKSKGFAWGGDFHGRKDQMHFSYCFEG